jgi:hypothetical protein
MEEVTEEETILVEIMEETVIFACAVLQQITIIRIMIATVVVNLQRKEFKGALVAMQSLLLKNKEK